MAVHWFEVQELSCPVVIAVCTGGFLGMQEQMLFLPIKGWVPCSPTTIFSSCAKKKCLVKWSVARCGDSMLGNKRCISVAVWEEALC